MIDVDEETAERHGRDPVTYAVAALATSVVSACPPGLIESIIKTARALRVSLRERLIRLLQLGEQAHVFDHNGRLVGECLDEVDLLVRAALSEGDILFEVEALQTGLFPFHSAPRSQDERTGT